MMDIDKVVHEFAGKVYEQGYRDGSISVRTEMIEHDEAYKAGVQKCIDTVEKFAESYGRNRESLCVEMQTVGLILRLLEGQKHDSKN